MAMKRYATKARFTALLIALLVSLVRGFEFATPEDCADVCDGVFAFHSKEEAEACCRLTRSLTDHTFPPTSAPTEMGTENIRDDSRGGDPGTTASCRHLGGPNDTSVRVRYGEYMDQCLLCVGATTSGDECGAPNTPSSASSSSVRISRWLTYIGSSVIAGVAMAISGASL